MRPHFLISAFASALFSFGISASAQTAATVTATTDPSQARKTAIPSDFEGMSFEMQTVTAAYSHGASWLNGTPGPYSNMMKLIGIKSIRVGGSTAETGTYPSTTDANGVNDFAQLIGANLIWTLPVENNYNVATYTSFAESMEDEKASKHETFNTTWEIGNESNGHLSYSEYQGRFDAYNSSLRQNVGTGETTTGPSDGGGNNYSNYLAEDSTYAGSLHSSIGFITQHVYPEGDANRITSVSAEDAVMLSANNEAAYKSTYDAFSAEPLKHGFKPRYEETNSISFGGYKGVSNAYAAALWMVDYLCYHAYNTELAGMNFHIGGNVGWYNAVEPAGYATSYTLMGGGYGMLAFQRNGQGYPEPVTLSNPDNVNLTAYALVESNGTEAMHVINRTYGSGAVDVTFNVSSTTRYKYAELSYLKQDNSDVTATSGISFGGQPVNGDGTWTGGYTENLQSSNGTFSISVPHAQAVVIHFYQ